MIHGHQTMLAEVAPRHHESALAEVRSHVATVQF
jgi:hypothetical protein